MNLLRAVTVDGCQINKLYKFDGNILTTLFFPGVIISSATALFVFTACAVPFKLCHPIFHCFQLLQSRIYLSFDIVWTVSFQM